MPGKTGKRAKAPGICVVCSQQIQIPSGETFMRDGKKDYHEGCWMKKFYPDGIHGTFKPAK